MDNPFTYQPFESKIKTIRPGDKMFRMHNGFMLSDRASIEISLDCPSRYANIIAECYNNGWIKPIAHVTEKEYVIMGLSNG